MGWRSKVTDAGKGGGGQKGELKGEGMGGEGGQEEGRVGASMGR